MPDKGNNHIHIHLHDQGCDHDKDGKCSCGHVHTDDNQHAHGESYRHDNESAFSGKLYAGGGETPAVYSKKIKVELVVTQGLDELSASLENWLKELQLQLKGKKVFIGHIKAFVEITQESSIWLSTTGKEISIRKDAGSINGDDITGFVLNITAIAFRTDAADLEMTVKDTFKKTVRGTFNDEQRGK